VSLAASKLRECVTRRAVTTSETLSYPGGVHVDHCHKTSVARGLLCYSCNAALGLARDRVDVLRRLIEYLERQR
jgi:hypothetical protein